MCYASLPRQKTVTYVCPVCGEKTLYHEGNADFVQGELAICHRLFSETKKNTDLSLSLDESSFCAKCAPKATEHQLALIVVYPDGRRHVSAPISWRDLAMLDAFLKGEDAYRTFNDGSRPLKPELPRLRELLGVPASAAKGKAAKK